MCPIPFAEFVIADIYLFPDAAPSVARRPQHLPILPAFRRPPPPPIDPFALVQPDLVTMMREIHAELEAEVHRDEAQELEDMSKYYFDGKVIMKYSNA